MREWQKAQDAMIMLLWCKSSFFVGQGPSLDVLWMSCVNLLLGEIKPSFSSSRNWVTPLVFIVERLLLYRFFLSFIGWKGS